MLATKWLQGYQVSAKVIIISRFAAFRAKQAAPLLLIYCLNIAQCCCMSWIRSFARHSSCILYTESGFAFLDVLIILHHRGHIHIRRLRIDCNHSTCSRIKRDSQKFIQEDIFVNDTIVCVSEKLINSCASFLIHIS